MHSFILMGAQDVALRAQTTYEYISQIQRDENSSTEQWAINKIMKRKTLWGLRKNVKQPSQEEINRELKSLFLYPSVRHDVWKEKAAGLYHVASKMPHDAALFISIEDAINVLMAWGNPPIEKADFVCNLTQQGGA